MEKRALFNPCNDVTLFSPGKRKKASCYPMSATHWHDDAHLAGGEAISGSGVGGTMHRHDRPTHGAMESGKEWGKTAAPRARLRWKELWPGTSTAGSVVKVAGARTRAQPVSRTHRITRHLLHVVSIDYSGVIAVPDSCSFIPLSASIYSSGDCHER